MNKKFITVILLFFSIINNSFAWEGVNFETNTPIEIGAGNLVREGLIIEFYEDGNLHNGRVLMMNEDSGGTELLIEDLDDNHREKTFIMRN